jgi:hypothetical protein
MAGGDTGFFTVPAPTFWKNPGCREKTFPAKGGDGACSDSSAGDPRIFPNARSKINNGNDDGPDAVRETNPTTLP